MTDHERANLTKYVQHRDGTISYRCQVCGRWQRHVSHHLQATCHVGGDAMMLLCEDCDAESLKEGQRD